MMARPIIRCLHALALSFLILGEGLYGQTLGPGAGAIPAGKSGYKIELDLKWPEGDRGVRPVKVRITREPLSTATRDQMFAVTISGNNWYDSTPGYRVTQSLVLPAGQPSVDVEMLVDLEMLWDYNSGMAQILIESGRGDGRFGKGDLLEVYESLGAVNQGWRGMPDEGSTWLLVSHFAPASFYDREYYFWPGMPQSQSPNWMSGMAMSDSSNGNLPGGPKLFGAPAAQTLSQANWMAIHPVDLPSSWVAMTSVDRVLISLPDLKLIHAQHPQSRTTLEKWVAAGGQLVVYDPDNKLDHADEILSLLIGTRRQSLAPSHDWVIVRPDSVAEAARKKMEGNLDDFFVNQMIKNSSASDLQDGDNCLYRRYLGGTICAVNNIDQWSQDTMERLEFQLKSHCEPPVTPAASVEQRGRSPIPGVGEPPVVLFIIFIAMFLLLVGPVMMIVLRSAPSRQYLFFAVPLFSLVTCLGILGYAVVVDYNKQWGRTESLTLLDQQAGMAYTQAVSAYYCGAQPKYYEFDAATAIRTALTSRDEMFVDYPGDERLRLSGTRILARRLHRVFACRAYETDQQLSIQAPSTGESGPRVTNRLGGEIEAVVFQFDGKFYWAEDVPYGGQAVGIETTSDELEKILAQRLPVDEARNQAGSGFPFLDGTQVVKVQREIRELRNQLAGKLDQSGNFMALMRSDPVAESLIEPFQYKFRYHLIHGRQ